MSKQLRFGFVGAGEVAVASAKAVNKASNTALERITDVRPELAADLAMNYGGRVAASIEELLADPLVDAVYVCVPHFLHRDVSLQAAAAGKHVYVEKPMGVNPSDAYEIIMACRRRGVACGVPFIARYAPAYRDAWHLVRSGTIGDITGFRITYRADKGEAYWSSGYSGLIATDWRRTWDKAGGGVLTMNTIHDLDAMLWITGLNVEYVQGVMANIQSHAEVEDVGMAIFSCSGGVFGSLEAHSALPGGQGPGQSWVNRIYGSEGQIMLPTPWGTDPLALFTRQSGQWQERPSTVPVDARQLALEDFAAAVLAGNPAPVPGEACLRASRLVHTVYDSARHGERLAVTNAGV